MDENRRKNEQHQQQQKKREKKQSTTSNQVQFNFLKDISAWTQYLSKETLVVSCSFTLFLKKYFYAPHI